MNATEVKLIKLIAKMQIENDGKKLKQKDVLENAGMTRANFNRYYSHLAPYITGEKNALSLASYLDGDNTSLNQEVIEKLTEVSQELDEVKSNFDKDLENAINKHITTLMMNDKVFHDSDDIRKELEKQALQNDSLNSKLKAKELEVTKLKQALLKNTPNSGDHEVSSIEPDLEPVFKNFKQTGDEDVFEVEKEVAIEKLAKNSRRIINSGNIRIVLYIDRYLCKFEKFLSDYFRPTQDSLVIRLPLFAHEEIDEFVELLDTSLPIDVYYPVSESQVVTKAQRKFFMNHVAKYELECADEFHVPSYKKFSSVHIFKVKLD